VIPELKEEYNITENIMRCNNIVDVDVFLRASCMDKEPLTYFPQENKIKKKERSEGKK